MEENISSKVSIVHIFNFLLQDSLTDNTKIVNLIEKNAVFLRQHQVEYLIVDNIKDNGQENLLLGNISKVPSYQKNELEYVRDVNADLKELFLTATKFASHQNIFFIFNELEIDINNVFDIEKSAPFLQKQDLNYFTQNVPPNFHPKNFKLYMKKNKNIIDRIKLLF
jgi:hypothetical protein